jgi:hypothetical protein
VAGRQLGGQILTDMDPLYRHTTRIFFGALYIFVLVGVNLIGYSIGTQHLSLIATKFGSSEGLLSLFEAFYFLCWGVRIMFFIEGLGR